MIRATAVLKFRSDILFDKPTEDDKAAIAAGVTQRGKKEPELDQNKLVLLHSHLTDNNEFCIPHGWVHGALQEAMRFQKIQKMSMMRYGGDLRVVGDYFVVMRNGKPVVAGDHTIDTRWHSVSVASGQKAKRIKDRARIHTTASAPLMVEITIEYEEKIFNLQNLTQLFKDAGTKIGLSNFRPQHQGDFGRFVLDEFIFVEQWDPHANVKYTGFPEEKPKKKDTVSASNNKASKAA